MTAASFPELFERVLVPAIFRPWGEDLLDRARPNANERILDVGCGTGIVARLIRERCGAGTRITGLDLNPDMISTARSLAPDIEWRQGNALELPFKDGSFDLVISQQALQFFPDRAAGAREMRRVLGPRGRLALSTWRPIEENPLYAAQHELATKHFGPNVDRRFSFGDADALRDLLREAGFRDIEIDIVTRHDRVVDPDTFVMMNLNATVDLGALPEDRCQASVAAFQAEARGTTARFRMEGALVHPVRANVARASV